MSRPLHILQVTPVYYPERQFGGPPQKIHAMSRWLVERGHQATVVTWDSERPAQRDRQIMDGVTVQYLPWFGRASWRVPAGWAALRKAVSEADVTHLYGLYNLLGPLAANAAGQKKRPFILEPLGMYKPRARSQAAKRLYHYFFTSRLLRQTKLLVATSEIEREDLAGLVDPKRLILRRNGIDVAAFANLPDRGCFRQRYGIGLDEKIILFVGRISPIKNLHTLLSAFAKAGVSSRLVLVGPMLEPDYAAQLQASAAAMAIDERVLFTGPLYDNDKLAALAAADFFVLPSISESYGNAAAEAVAAGLPVLLTTGCGIAPDIDGRVGLAVEADENSLARGLRTMIGNQDVAKRFKQCQSDVLMGLGWHEPMVEMESLYYQIASLDC